MQPKDLKKRAGTGELVRHLFGTPGTYKYKLTISKRYVSAVVYDFYQNFDMRKGKQGMLPHGGQRSVVGLNTPSQPGAIRVQKAWVSTFSLKKY